MEYLIWYLIAASSFTIMFYFRYIREVIATVKQFEFMYYDENVESAIGFGIHIGYIIAVFLYFPKMVYTTLRYDRKKIIKTMATEAIKVHHGEVSK